MDIYFDIDLYFLELKELIDLVAYYLYGEENSLLNYLHF